MSPSPLDRREFLKGLAATGLVIVVSSSGCRRLEEALRGAPKGTGETFSPAAYVRVGDDGGVTVICHRSEMGRASGHRSPCWLPTSSRPTGPG
jgi:isoquinoline 1-oxidoreductase beta subunit